MGRRRSDNLVRLAVVGVIAGAVAVGLALLVRSRRDDDAARDPVTGDSIVMLGDSITEQGEWDQLLPDLPVVDRGYSGFTTAELVEVAADAAADRPAAVFVLAGTNDIRDDLPAARTRVDYARLLDELAASPDTVIVVQTLLPRADAVDEVRAANGEIVELADERGLPVLDLHHGFDDGSGGLRPAETVDGIHLSEAGYARWATHLRPVMERIVADAPPITEPDR